MAEGINWQKRLTGNVVWPFCNVSYGPCEALARTNVPYKLLTGALPGTRQRRHDLLSDCKLSADGLGVTQRLEALRIWGALLKLVISHIALNGTQNFKDDCSQKSRFPWVNLLF